MDRIQDLNHINLSSGHVRVDPSLGEIIFEIEEKEQIS